MTLMFNNQTLNQRVYIRLRDMITSGTIMFGMQLDEQALANEMGISRTPIREAIAKLVKEGLVEYRPYRGNFVRSFTAKQVSDLFEVRKTLEGLAMQLAVSHLTGEHLQTLHTILSDIDTALEQYDMEAYSAADRRFHATIVQIADNESLRDLLEWLGFQIQVVRTIANRDPHVVERTAHERPLILAALEARDAQLATQLLQDHIEGVRRAVVAQFEEHAITQLDKAMGS
ncbi:MAG: GntR family transcriptional regulator [Herpetosiphon sp.]